VTVADPGATYIDESVEVGPDTVIEPGVCLRGATRVGRGCALGPHSIVTDSVLGDRVTVRSNCVITNCQIGSDVILGPFAHLRDGALIEPEARIGNFVEVKKSKVGRGSKSLHLTYLGDATLGAKVNIGAGTVTCNYDGEKKHPTIIEDGVFIGSGTMLVAPVSVGKGSYVAAGSTITQNVPPESLALGRALQVNKEGWVRTRKQSQAALSVSERRVGEAAVLDVVGRVTFGESAKELGKRIRQAIDAGRRSVVVNLSGVAYIDSSGLGELVGALSRMREAGGEIKLTVSTPHVLHIFRIAHLEQVFEIYPQEAAALASLTSAK
jgi:anti-anti-sigma factor